MNNYEENNLLERFHKNIRPYVKAVKEHEFGLMNCISVISDIECGGIELKNQINYGDRFLLKINYCQKTLVWQVIMSSNPLIPPDFIMEENFLLDLDADSDMIANKIPSLAYWDPTNENCLLKVILELIDLYRDYQLDIMKKNPSLHRFLFEYEVLTQMTHVAPSDIELSVNDTNRGISVAFIININVDFTSLPIPLPENKSLAVLVIEFRSNNTNSCYLRLCNEVELALGNIILPELSPDMALMNYVPQIGDILQTKVSSLREGLDRRRIFLLFILEQGLLKNSVLYLDHVQYHSMTLMISVKAGLVNVNILVTAEFPKEKPSVTIYTEGYKNKHTLQDYPYNPNWTPKEMALKLCDALKKFLKLEFY